MSLGPEMKSTGEVLGVSENLYEAIYKGFIAGGFKFTSKNKKYLATIKDSDKEEFLHISKKLNDLGYEAYATEGTYEFLKSNDVSTIKVEKLENGSEEILDLMQKGYVDFVVNTPTLGNNSKKDGFKIRRVAVENGIDIFTSLDTISLFSDILVKKITLENVDVCSI
jgi:carbamoyl-phosphate synthase large subunit